MFSFSPAVLLVVYHSFRACKDLSILTKRKIDIFLLWLSTDDFRRASYKQQARQLKTALDQNK